MADIDWPADLLPRTAAFYLRPHVGGSRSPITRTRKMYGLSKPIWVCRLTFTANYRGGLGLAAWGARLDALIAELDGGLNRAGLWDFRRPYPAGLRRYYSQFLGEQFSFGGGETFAGGEQFIFPPEAEPVNEAAAAGATTMVFGGFLPGETVFHIGDYVGGDDRPHILLRDATAGADGRATVQFKPPLDRAVPVGGAKTMRSRGWFRLTSEDAGLNESAARGRASYSLEFEEDVP